MPLNPLFNWDNKKYEVSSHFSNKRLLINLEVLLNNRELDSLLIAKIDFPIKRPVSLLNYGIKSYQQILAAKPAPPSPPGTEDSLSPSTDLPVKQAALSYYYLDLCQEFSVTHAPPPPKEHIFLGPGIRGKHDVYESSISFPDDYYLSALTILIPFDMTDYDALAYIGAQSIPIEPSDDTRSYQWNRGDSAENPQPYLSGEVVISIFITPKSASVSANLPINPLLEPLLTADTINLQLMLTRTDESLLHWQFAIYEKLQQGYEQQLSYYHEQLEKLNQFLLENDALVTQSWANKTSTAGDQKTMDRKISLASNHIIEDHRKFKIGLLEHIQQPNSGFKKIEIIDKNSSDSTPKPIGSMLIVTAEAGNAEDTDPDVKNPGIMNLLKILDSEGFEDGRAFIKGLMNASIAASKASSIH